MDTPAEEEVAKVVTRPLIHIESSSYSGEPFEEGEGKYQYLSYYKNEHGERWVFGIDQDGYAFLTGNDVDWIVRRISGGKNPVSDWILNEGESLWLQSCWFATRWMRVDADLDVPIDVLTIPRAARIWELSEATLKKDAVSAGDKPPKLAATKVGGVWMTTARAMAAAYGIPEDSVRGDIVRMLLKYRKHAEKKAQKRSGANEGG